MSTDILDTSAMHPEVINAAGINEEIVDNRTLDKSTLDKNVVDKTDKEVDKQTLQPGEPDIHAQFYDNKRQYSDTQPDKLDISQDNDHSQALNDNPIAHYPDRMVFTSDRGRRYEFFAPNAYDLLGVNYADLFGGETQAMITFLTKLCPEFTQKTARHLSFKDIIQLIAGANTFLGKQLGPSST